VNDQLFFSVHDGITMGGAGVWDAVVVGCVFAVIAYAVVRLEQRMEGAVYLVVGGISLCVEMYAAWESARDDNLISHFCIWRTDAKILFSMVLAYNGGAMLRKTMADIT
jgi:hypothetical protein